MEAHEHGAIVWERPSDFVLTKQRPLHDRKEAVFSSGSPFSPAKFTMPSWGLQFHDVIFSSITPQGIINRWIRGTGSQLMNFQGRGIAVKWAIAHTISDLYQRTLIFKVGALLRRWRVIGTRQTWGKWNDSQEFRLSEPSQIRLCVLLEEEKEFSTVVTGKTLTYTDCYQE